jgi:3'(2'), 5'-bisphosphate nucleotidase
VSTVNDTRTSRVPVPSWSDHRAARHIADAAGAVLIEIRAGLAQGAAPQDVRNDGDRRSHDEILSLLRRTFPADAVLSEEAPDDLQRLSAERVWIVDPLDGTREFGETGRDDWAVHIALVERGRLTAGAVAMPARETTYSTENTCLAARVAGSRLRIAVSRTRPAAEAELLAARLDADLVPMGSAGAKAMAVIAGEVDIYIHSGGQYVWDSAAPAAVAEAAGLHTSRIDGTALSYAEETTWLPDLVICRPELRNRVLTELAHSASGQAR